MMYHATRRMLSMTVLRTSELFSVSDGTARSVNFYEPVKQNPCLCLFSSPKIIVPSFEPTRRIGTFVSQTIYQLFYERAYHRERFISVANEGASLIGECIANEEWNRMSFLASSNLVEQAKIARRRCTDDQINMLRFDPNDTILSFLHSSFISLRNFGRKYDHGIVCIYFTSVSFIRTSDLVPYEATLSQILDDFRSNVLVLNITFARNLSPLGQWKATGINFFVLDAVDHHIKIAMDGDDGFDYLFKIVLIGDMGVGKTCVVQRFRNGTYMDRQGTTIGVDFTMKTLVIEGKRVKLQIWDTGGQERFRTITQSYYRSANGIVLCYDITCKQSFSNLQRWIDDVSKFAAPNVVKLLVATKCDLEEQRVIEREEGEIVQRANGMFSMIETSAKNNMNVDAAFLELAKILKRQYDQGVLRDPAGTETFRLGSGGTTPIGKTWQQCCHW